MTKRTKPDLTPEQWIAVGVVGAAAVGLQLFREARKSPAEKAQDRRRNAERHAAKREYETRSREARQLDTSRWKQFEDDSAAQAALDADCHIPIFADQIDAQVTSERGSNYGHAWAKVTAKLGAETLVVLIDYDGGSSLNYTSPTRHYHSRFYTPRGYAVIGDGDGPVTDVQARAAGFLRSMQKEGYFPGIISLARLDRRQHAERHYATYAAARGWPESKNAEEVRVRRAYTSGL